MIRYLLFCCICFGGLSGGILRAQDLSAFHLYHPEEDGAAGIKAAIREAGVAHKNVFVEIGAPGEPWNEGSGVH